MNNYTSTKNRVALAVCRLQPLHNGHCRIIDRMIRNYEKVILCIGSSQKSRERWDPYTFEERKKMVQNVYGDRIKIVQLNDLGTTEGTNDWVEYVINKITKIGMAEPTDYFTGSLADARWYTEKFFLEGVSPWNEENPLSGEIQKGNEIYYNNGVMKLLHIVDRDKNTVPSATELRTFMELKQDDWKEWIPAVNWEIVDENFPEEFRVG